MPYSAGFQARFLPDSGWRRGVRHVMLNDDEGGISKRAEGLVAGDAGFLAVFWVGMGFGSSK